MVLPVGGKTILVAVGLLIAMTVTLPETGVAKSGHAKGKPGGGEGGGGGPPPPAPATPPTSLYLRRGLGPSGDVTYQTRGETGYLSEGRPSEVAPASTLQGAFAFSYADFVDNWGMGLDRAAFNLTIHTVSPPPAAVPLTWGFAVFHCVEFEGCYYLGSGHSDTPESTSAGVATYRLHLGPQTSLSYGVVVLRIGVFGGDAANAVLLYDSSLFASCLMINGPSCP